MDTISFSSAKKFVRASIDELAETSDMLVGDSLDDRNLHLIVKQHLPEALDTIVLNAPSYMLDGIDVDSDDYTVTVSTGEIKYLSIDTEIDNFLRLASFREGGTGVVLTECVDEDSPVGRMQLNPYVCGTADKPVLVRVHTTDDSLKFRYYLPKSSTPNITEFKYVPRGTELTNDNDSLYCPARLKTAVLDYLVGLVLQTYNESEKANIFITRANEMLK